MNKIVYSSPSGVNCSLCGVEGVYDAAVGGGDFTEGVLDDLLAEGGGDG